MSIQGIQACLTQSTQLDKKKKHPHFAGEMNLDLDKKKKCDVFQSSIQLDKKK